MHQLPLATIDLLLVRLRRPAAALAPGARVAEAAATGARHPAALTPGRAAPTAAGEEQVQLAKAAGFRSAEHYEVGFGLMGVLVATK